MSEETANTTPNGPLSSGSAGGDPNNPEPTGTGDGSVGTALFGKHLAARAPMTTAWLTGVAIVGVAGAILLPIVLILLRPDTTVLRYVNDDAYARGTITLLFSLGTIGVALIVAIVGVWRVMGDGAEAAKARFERGKDVLSILVGILGTIIGFYFANGQNDAGDATIQLAGPTIEAAAEANTLELDLALAGGTPPYQYSLTFDPPIEGAWTNLRSESGLISQRLPVPASRAGQAVEVTIKASDQNDVDLDRTVTLRLPGTVAQAGSSDAVGGDQADG